MKALIQVTGSQRALADLPLGGVDDKPTLFHTIARLEAVQEIDEIILAIDHAGKRLRDVLVLLEKGLDIKINLLIANEYSNGGWLDVAKKEKVLTDRSGPFFLLRTNVIVDYPFKEMIEFHRRHGCEATMLISKVDKPSRFDSFRVECFNGPHSLMGSLVINTQIYLFSSSILRRDLSRSMSLERSILPALAREGNLFSMPLKGPYIDLGDDGYQMGLKHFFEYMNPRIPHTIQSDPDVVTCGNIWIDATSSVTGNSRIGPDVIIGPDCKISDSYLAHSVLMKDASVPHYGHVVGCIMGSGSSVSPNTAVYPVSLIGDGVEMDDADRELLSGEDERARSGAVYRLFITGDLSECSDGDGQRHDGAALDHDEQDSSGSL